MSRKYIAPYSAEFKESAIQLALESDHLVSQISKNSGIVLSTLNKWIKELNRITLERDMLKKAVALCKRKPLKYTWIKEYRRFFPISQMYQFNGDRFLVPHK